MLELVALGAYYLFLKGIVGKARPPQPAPPYRQFEYACANWLTQKGYATELTPPRDDGNVDIYVSHLGRPCGLAECKSWTSRVGAAPVKVLHATMLQLGYRKGWFFSRNGFSRGAREYAKAIPEEILLVDEV